MLQSLAERPIEPIALELAGLDIVADIHLSTTLGRHRTPLGFGMSVDVAVVGGFGVVVGCFVMFSRLSCLSSSDPFCCGISFLPGDGISLLPGAGNSLRRLGDG